MISASQAMAWWNPEWNYRRRITFDLSQADSHPDHAVLLLRLHSANFDFTRGKEDGADLRFVNHDDTTLLSFHLEKYDFLDEIALVWVKLTGLPCASGNNFFWVYYGNPAAEPAEDVPGTYDEHHVAVFHFRESEGLPQDQTAYGNHASEFTGGQGMPALIGNGIFFNGISDHMVIPGNPDLDFSDGFTFSAWVKIGVPQKDAYIFSMEDGKQGFVIGLEQNRVYVRVSDKAGPVSIKETNTEFSSGIWHHLAVSMDEGNRLALYLDGTEQYSQELGEGFPEMAGDLSIGGSIRGGHFFAGDLDEIQISNRARTGSWIALNTGSQGPDGQIFGYGLEEIKHQGSAFARIFYQYFQYLRTIVRNTTVDGALIIGVLLIMFTVSEIVLLSKFLSLWMIERENRGFLDSFRSSAQRLSFNIKKEDFQNSPLFRIYTEGMRELKQRLGNPGISEERKGLSQKAINSFKAVLEKASAHEEQKLNNWLLILTFAISGAPFLGLLGTVWGVMNTFAAMAAAGEADIVVIAPGIASALSTTVVGLIVAIPALFGYNVLVGKIKNITADIYLFVDDLTCQADETYGEER